MKTLQDWIEEAKAKHGKDIKPCSNRTWEQCLITYKENGKTVFYYNSPDHSTHMLVEEEENKMK